MSNGKELIQLSDLRKKKGLSQKELALRVNLTPSAIGNYESGRRSPCVKIAVRIADFFDVSVNQISFANMSLKKVGE